MVKGDVFALKDRGRLQLWTVSEVMPNGKIWMAGAVRRLGGGDTVHFAVRSNGLLVSRKSYVLKPGDAVWCDSGIPQLDLSKRVDPVRGFATTGKNVFVNRFVGGPKWLREVE